MRGLRIAGAALTRVAVIGAGIIGVTTAYELAAAGHEVTVFDRRGSVAEGASFATAGVLAAGLSTPGAAPGQPWALLTGLARRDPTVRVHALGALMQLPWLWRWWRACRRQVHGAHGAAMLALARFSRERLLELTNTLHLVYEQRQGVTVLLRRPQDLHRAQPMLRLLQAHGIGHDVIDPGRCREIEVALNPDTPLHAGIHLHHEGVGNCRQFAHLLKSEAQRMGVRFTFDTDVRGIEPGTRPKLLKVDGTEQTFDAVIVCAGAQAQPLLSSVGLRLPLLAVHGHSVTAPLRHIDSLLPVGPQSAVVDARYRVTISRLGQRVRVTGGAELGGSPHRANPRALRLLYRVLDDWYPGAVRSREAQQWKGAIPTLPDGPPVLGASGAPGIWLNLGHGSSGWALACGCARVLAEQLSGREAPLDVTQLSVARLR